MRRVSVLAAVVMMASVGVGAGWQATAELVSPTAQIPRAQYKTWSLFLVCNPDWVAPEKAADLANLYHRFKSFGDAIGRDNLAVWFWKRQVPVSDPTLAENVDVARSAEFCGALQRPPSQGPYLVVTTAYPDVAAFPRERAIFELGGLPPADVAKLLNTLTDQLLLQGRVDATLAAASGAAPGATPAPAPTSSLWIRLLEGARQSMIGFGCKVKLQIDTGLLSAELRECAAH
ncbi:MAG: hypothetical protein ACHQO8_02175 [Vicinamibacterales bacterium]